MTTPGSNTPWHHMNTSEVLAKLDSHPDGLSQQQAEARLRQHGPNRLAPPQTKSLLSRFINQFNNMLIYVLLLSAIITAALQHWTDCGVILAVVFLNALIGVIQEGKAEKALQAIARMLSQQAVVVREGRSFPIPAEELVPGDVVLLQSGDKVAADLRLLHSRQLAIDEAMLTGESLPTGKDSTLNALEAVVADRSAMAYSGTLVTYGQGKGVVVSTGMQTEIGRISGMLGEIQKLTTPLVQQMDQFGRWLSIAILFLAAFTFVFGTQLRDYSAVEMFMAAVGLAVAAIPEGLPAVMTITLAIGVQHMAGRKAIIRRLPAVETLGSVNVICTDKTGTLTLNEMMVQSVLTGAGLYRVSGEGYNPHGTFTLNGEEQEPAEQPELLELARAASLCNDARIERQEEQWCMHGDPTEGALISMGMKAGLDMQQQQLEWPRSDVIPFESQHRYMATLHHDHNGHGLAYIKGAPERILQMCNYQHRKGEQVPLEPDFWEEHSHRMADQGQRLLAIAYRETSAEGRELRFDELDGHLTLLGIVGIIDPPRQEAIRAIGQCREANIRVKMITGDHAVTAMAIARQMGISRQARASTGPELDKLDPQQLGTHVDKTDIFARASPENKLRIVEALQARGYVVAMTGDGVNDAPALKRADVGIAMGIKGTEVSKEAAEMVLTDDNFAAITHAVEEGRTVYDNLQKAILFLLPTSIAEAITLLAAILLGMALPITPVQILWVNLVTAVTLGLALAFEPGEAHVMQRPPRATDAPILNRLLLWRIAFVSAILVAGCFGLYLWHIQQGYSLEYARTVALNTLVMFEMFYLFSTRFIYEPVLNLAGFTGNRYMVIAIGFLIIIQVAFTYTPYMHLMFGTAPINTGSWVSILLTASSVLFLVEAEKSLLRRRAK